ncbi:amino acid ABC transporter permease [Bosea sp. (in: a-proteobacteria)]|uniref:amino acid ABC transporter permease n=1 Tax=Bosea sp. (in: a-proteobacteria) TaxID=1871050 RepID=UPI002604D148|nr:amino acid ABC transporter permease [Bosea sp. (in: a-proteobacteria)]MCO5089845.1 amino acid ABC transporter permease [Bosea sp. (in: a-proteobacteria)]
MADATVLVDSPGGIGNRAEPGAGHPELRVLRRRHPWRQFSAVVALAVLAGMVWSLANNPNVGIDLVREYLTAPAILRGIGVTLYLTVVAMVLGVSGGVLMAVMRLSDNAVLSGIAKFYIWIFRGTPMLVQLIFWAYAGAIYPTISIGVPFTDIVFWSSQTADLIDPMMAALLALTFNQVAYASEIIRGGILSVDHGQTEAAYSLGMGPARTMRRIVLPQAMRTIIPPMGNDVISMLKTTSLVSVIGGQDLMTTVQFIYSENFQVIPLLIVASLWYLFFTTLLAIPQSWLEKRYGRGVASQVRRGV